MDQRVSLRFGFVALGVAAVLATTLAGCGRKGPLELPPNAPPTAQSQALPETRDAASTRTYQTYDNPGLIQPPNKVVEIPAKDKLNAATQAHPRPINAPPAPPAKPFVLDPLL